MTLLRQLTAMATSALLATVGIQLAAEAQVAEPAVGDQIDKTVQLATESPSEPDSTLTAESLPSVQLEPDSVFTSPTDEAISEANEIAQVRRRRPPIGSSSSFIGIGGNIGFGDDGVPGGDPAFAVISKLGLTNRFAVRPAALIGDDVSFLVPVTYSFTAFPNVGRFDPQPYVGGGVAFSVGDDSEVAGLVSAGLDVPLSRQFTANGQANLSIGDESGFGVTLGVGYNFGSLVR